MPREILTAEAAEVHLRAQIEALEVLLFDLREQLPRPFLPPQPLPESPPRRTRAPRAATAGPSESEIQKRILLAIGTRDDLLIMRRNVGFARDPVSGRAIRFGTVGEGDLQGVLRVACNCGRIFGQAVALEAKTATGRQSDAQRLWERAWTRRGGIYAVVRSVEDAVDALERAKRGAP
jgi:hypothetical protein